jgi:predicted permease
MSRWPFLRSLRPGQVRSDAAEDIHEEIELYLDLRAAELEEQGMNPVEARRLAQERFGDPKRIERELRRQAKRRDMRQGTTMTMGGIGRDLGYAARSFRMNPGFFGVAVITLALALGGNTAIFSVVDAALLQALPFEDHEELVFVNGYHLVDGEVSIRGASFPEFRDWRERTRSLSSLVAVDGTTLTLTGDGEAEQLSAELVTEGYFALLGGSPERGRTFLAEEHGEPGAHPVAVISDGLWERRFGRDQGVVGRDLVVNDRPLTIIGVMPPTFGGTNLTTDVWVPASMISLVSDPGILDARGSRFLTVIGRLAPGSDIASAQTELDVVARDLQASFPEAHEDRFAQVETFRDGYLGSTGGLLWILMGAGGVLLLIAAANVANLLLVRSHGRAREFVLRRALGAESSRIASQLLTESVLLALVGGVAGMTVAVWALSVLGPMIPAGVLPGYVEPALSRTAFVFSLVALTFVGLTTGLVPAVASARIDLAGQLREGGRAGMGSGRRGPSAQQVFVVAQVALALVLMVGAGLLTRSVRAQLAVDTGAEIEGVQAMRIVLPNSRYDSNEVVWSFAGELERRLDALPGVVVASLASDLPFRGGSSASYILKEGSGPEERIRFHRHFVTPSYFRTLGVELVEGRYLTDDDVDGAAGVIVITESMARRVYPGESAVGRIMWLDPAGTQSAEIVGVVEDVRYRDVTTSLMADANSPDVFFSYWQIPSRGIEVAVRAQGDAETVGPAMRGVVAELDSDLPIFGLEPLGVAWRAQTATPRFAAFLMSLFSGLAAILACVGIYGVLAFAVGQRSQEIAIRRAIGASGGSVARAVVVDGLKLAMIGLFLGGAGALAGSRVLERFLFGVETTDPVTFLTVSGGMITVAVVAALLPALRATRRDPADALKAE